MERGRASTLSIETGDLSSEGETPTNTAEGNRRSNYSFLFTYFYQTLLEFSQVQKDADIQDLLTKVITEDKDKVSEFF